MARSRKALTDGDRVIFTPSYWSKRLNRRVYASEFGKKAFCFVFRAEHPKSIA